VPPKVLGGVPAAFSKLGLVGVAQALKQHSASATPISAQRGKMARSLI